uniref:Short chain dehydrogenase n=1 Tax=Colletotrichum fructicola (strain Nara gc5) TaxID=1213859 RepID=L2FUX2_COLFN
MPRLASKVCIITGSSSGLGRAIALTYATEGAHIVCADLQPTARAEVESEGIDNTDDLIRQNGGKAIFFKTDMTKPEQVENLVSKSTSPTPTKASSTTPESPSKQAPPLGIHETPLETWDLTMSVNATSVFLGCKYAIAQMLTQPLLPSGDRGWIVNVSSIFGLVGGRHNISYAASKGAVSNLTRQVAMDYAEARIHCNAICPGYVKTAIFVNTVKTLHSPEAIAKQHPFRGVGTPEDIVGAAVFLASDDARWITGICMPVDGGYTAQ